MFSSSLQDFTHAWQYLKNLLAVSMDALHFRHVALMQFRSPLANAFVGKTFIPQSLRDNLQVSHARHFHFVQPARSAKHSFQYRRGIVLVGIDSGRSRQRAINVPEKYARGFT